MAPARAARILLTFATLKTLLVVALAACASKVPETRYYQLAALAAAQTRAGDAVPPLELAGDAAPVVLGGRAVALEEVDTSSSTGSGASSSS